MENLTFWQKLSANPLYVILGLATSIITIVLAIIGIPGFIALIVAISKGLLFALSWLWATVLNVNTPVWLCILLVGLAAVIPRMIQKERKPKESVKDWAKRMVAQAATQVSTPEPEYFKYTKDVVDKWTFRWTYNKEERGMPPTIVNMYVVCPDCDEPLLTEDYRSGYAPGVAKRMYCAICNKRFPLFDLNSDNGRIGIIIRHTIRERYGKT